MELRRVTNAQKKDADIMANNLANKYGVCSQGKAYDTNGNEIKNMVVLYVPKEMWELRNKN